MKSQALIHIPLALGFKHKLREFRTGLDSAHNLSWKLLLFLLSVALLDGRFRYGIVHYIGNKTCWTPPLAGQNAQLFTHTQLCQTLRTIKRFLKSTHSAVRQKQALKCSSNWHNTSQAVRRHGMSVPSHNLSRTTILMALDNPVSIMKINSFA